MDQLSQEEQADVKKMSSERIRLVLARDGADVDELTKADRAQLLDMMAHHMLNGGNDEGANAAPEDRHLQLLERQIQLQEAELRFRQEQAERERLERATKDAVEHQWRQRQFELEREKQKSEAVRQQSLAARIKFYGDALKLSTVKMTDEPGDLPHFFTSLENVFDMYEVPSDLRAKLTIPLLTTKAKTLLARLPIEKMSDFSELRKFLLSEFRLTSEQYRERFLNAKRKHGETFTLLCSRLRSLFLYYLTSRKVGKDFDKLVSLMVADRLKEEMPTACLKHVLGIKTAGDCLSCDKLAEAADVYMHSHLASGVPRIVAGQSGHGTNSVEVRQTSSSSVSQPGMVGGFGRGRGSASTGKACYQCGSRDHLVSFHKRNPISTSGVMRSGQRATGLSSAHVNRCVVQHVADDFVNRPVHVLPGYRIDLDNDTRELIHDLKQYSVDSDAVETIEGDVNHVDDSAVSENVDDDEDDDEWIYAVDPLSIAYDHVNLCMNARNVNCSVDNDRTCFLVHLSKMRYRDIAIQEIGYSHIGLEDTGAEVCIVRGDLIRGLDVPRLGKIRLRGIVGDCVVADLVQLNIKPASTSNADVNSVEYSQNIGPFIQVVFAVCDNMVDGQDIISTADAVEKLNKLCDYNVQLVVAKTDDDEVRDSDVTSLAVVDDLVAVAPHTSGSSDSNDSTKVNETELEQGGETEGCADVETLQHEQMTDSSLQTWWKLARQKKGNFFVKNKLLFHREKILGHNVEQLCLPDSRVAPVLKLGHDAHFSGHYAYKTTMNKIRLSFYFPDMIQKIKDYCTSCHDCQMRARELGKNRTPITPIPRNEIPFAHLWWDCIGPLLDPTECKGRPNYCLIIIIVYYARRQQNIT